MDGELTLKPQREGQNSLFNIYHESLGSPAVVIINQ